jgi:hypothetical protein
MRAMSIVAVWPAVALCGADAVVITTSSARAAGTTDNKPRAASAKTPARTIIFISIKSPTNSMSEGDRKYLSNPSLKRVKCGQNVIFRVPDGTKYGFRDRISSANVI